jgi:hypothetical protein
MKEMVFITLQKGTQGSYLNHLDLQQHLKDHEGYKIKFYCENVKKLYEIINNTRRSYVVGKGEIKILRKEIVEPDIVITDFKTVITAKELGMWVICKKLLIMDSIELTYHLKDMKHARFFHEVDLHESLRQFYTNETVFLMPPSNHTLFKKKYPHLNAKVFFKNINTDMLNTIKFENRDGYFFRWDDLKDYTNLVKDRFGNKGFNFEPDWMIKQGKKIPLKYNEVDHLFNYTNLVYRRRKYLEYQEQFGRLIFEYILLGKTVQFFDDPYTDDGLTDYLKHFDIKFDSSNKIITTKEELTNKMRGYIYKPWEDI